MNSAEVDICNTTQSINHVEALDCSPNYNFNDD